MSTYRIVHMTTVRAVTTAGFELLPTFSRPHFTLRLASDGADELVRLLAILGPSRENPYERAAARRGRRAEP